MTTKPKHLCCDGECYHDSCCGKIPANCPLNHSYDAGVEAGKAQEKPLIGYTGASFQNDMLNLGYKI